MRLARVHILPTLGPLQLQLLDEQAIESWIAGLGTALSPKSVRNVHGVLSAALTAAMSRRHRLVVRNPARNVENLPKVPTRPDRAWTEPQLRTFLAAIETDRLAPLWRLIATTGMRRGEALGLRWSDVDIERGALTIVRQRCVAGGSVVEGAPKSKAGERTIRLDATTTATLKAWRARQATERLAMGAGWHPGDYVFTHPTGEPLWPQMVTARFKSITERLGLPAIGVHGLRHTAATWMIASGVSPKVVTQRLGHSHVATTLSLYSHVAPGHDQAAADAFAAALDA